MKISTIFTCGHKESLIAYLTEHRNITEELNNTSGWSVNRDYTRVFRTGRTNATP